jgi:hypothetical protein
VGVATGREVVETRDHESLVEGVSVRGGRDEVFLWVEEDWGMVEAERIAEDEDELEDED